MLYKVADIDYLHLGENFASCCTLQISEALFGKGRQALRLYGLPIEDVS
jgi:hypothetical protein